MNAIAHEVNFDGIVGPTHNYAGLSYGNLASQRHRLSISNPKHAALQGLAKMKFLSDLGVRQAVLPPHERPDIGTLRRLGFDGSDADVLFKVAREDRRLLAAVCSASSMWAANAATISPSTDTADGRVHITPANLVTQFHRSLETQQTAVLLRAMFPDESAFAHHPPLPSNAYFADEGAANHMRLCMAHGEPGLEIFVYGRAASAIATRLAKFPARQAHEASSAIARLHQLDPGATLLFQQSPAAIDAGVFHNDVVAVANQNVLLSHHSAYADPASSDRIREIFESHSGEPLFLIEATQEQVSLKDAVESYLFNSQLVTLPDRSMSLIAPMECRECPSVYQFIQQLLSSNTPIRTAHFLDVRQSMHNGGGPACLRLRVVLTESELSLVHGGVFLTDLLYEQLKDWINRHYRDRLAPEDLSDPNLLDESRTALEELSLILKLQAIYSFQR